MLTSLSNITSSAEQILDEVAEAVVKQKEVDFIIGCYRKFITSKKLIAEFNSFLYRESMETETMSYIVQMKSENMSDYHLPNG